MQSLQRAQGLNMNIILFSLGHELRMDIPALSAGHGLSGGLQLLQFQVIA
jgi:hypothetical protein